MSPQARPLALREHVRDSAKRQGATAVTDERVMLRRRLRGDTIVVGDGRVPGYPAMVATTFRHSGPLLETC